MRLLHLALIVPLVSFATLPPTVADGAEEQARHAALRFGRALTGDDASALGAVLPQRGKVRLHLVRFGPEEGAYSGEQVQAVFDDFLRVGAVRTFDLIRLRSGGEGFVLAHARAHVVDRDGRSADVRMHLTFQPEGDRWVLREIREAPP